MKILLVEDDQPTSLALADTLMAHDYTVNLAVDGQRALELATTFEYDLILLDVGLPKLDGISVCRHLRSLGYKSPILLLTAKDHTTDRVMGLDAGADDYVVKPFNTEELMARVRALLRRDKIVKFPEIIWENVRFDTINKEVRCGEQLLHLTPKEYCLLELFLLNPKRVFNRSHILERLWDISESPGEETVSTHIKCLRQKLKAAGASDPIETVHGLGYRLRQPSPSKESVIFATPFISNQKKQHLKATTNQIWEKFQHKFAQQIVILEQVATALQTNQLTVELQQQGQQQAHKLAGSLGIFGLMDGSQLARKLEGLLEQQIVLEASAIKQIVELVELLRQEICKTPELALEPEQQADSPLILIVDDDLTLAEKVRMEAIAWGLRVAIAPDLKTAQKAIAQNLPDVILLDLAFPSPVEDGRVLLKQLTQKIPQIPVIAFTVKGSLNDRLEVARLGGSIFLQKPLPTYEILKAVTDVLNQNRSQAGNKVMIVDDDATMLTILSTILEKLSIEVTTLSNPQQFWEVLTTSNPDLLVLDLSMPGLSGLDLCQIVRSDAKWHHLPILFWSAHTESTEIDQAFAVGADGYMSKSTQLADLTTQIVRRLKRVGFRERGESAECC
ncbi:response regulator [Nostoc sp. TCL26-01]|uniref:response regulator n=1 Tax=Nostoc sp. TCL26-01 TaxID=2576904 RepID=UPI0015BB8F40|nr:response regulator [Nostoc sp. TCL26-01]QLE57374.1 response regulator [Nostoc sp. TCL26-01]